MLKFLVTYLPSVNLFLSSIATVYTVYAALYFKGTTELGEAIKRVLYSMSLTMFVTFVFALMFWAGSATIQEITSLTAVIGLTVTAMLLTVLWTTALLRQKLNAILHDK